MSVRFTSNVGSFLDAFRSKARQEVAALAPEGERIAKSHCPVDTGFLRGTITCRPKAVGLGLVWQATAPHAYHVHEGTPRMAARPFLTIAVLEIEGRLQAAVGRSLKG